MAAVDLAVWANHGVTAATVGAVPLLVGPHLWHGALPAESWPAAASSLQRRTGAELRPVLVPQTALQRTLAALPDPAAATAVTIAEAAPVPPWPIAWPLHLAPAELARHLLLTAITLGVSDLHIEVAPDHFRLAARRHGRLRPLPPLTSPSRRAVLEEIRCLGGLTPLQTGQHAEGRLRLPLPDRAVDFRLQSQPALDGEALTARLLDPARLATHRQREHLPPAVAAAGEAFFHSPGGLFLIVGPTDSGKTTTLHALLHLLDPSAHRIITLESPVEYRLPGLVQIPVDRDPDSRLHLAEALASSLRAAPDLLVCGEIRTAVEAHVAIEAALTGHRVLATLHAGDVAGARLRLRGLGIPDDFLHGALHTLVAQRLGQRPCPFCGLSCPRPDPFTAVAQSLGWRLPPLRPGPPGCAGCDDGVAGRQLVALPWARLDPQGASEAWTIMVQGAFEAGNLTPESALRLLSATVSAIP